MEKVTALIRAALPPVSTTVVRAREALSIWRIVTLIGVDGPIAGDHRVLAVLGRQIDRRGADIRGVDAVRGERVDHSLLALVGLVHRRRDIRRHHLDAHVGGHRVGRALHLPGSDDGHLTALACTGAESHPERMAATVNNVAAQTIRRIMSTSPRRGSPPAPH